MPHSLLWVNNYIHSIFLEHFRTPRGAPPQCFINFPTSFQFFLCHSRESGNPSLFLENFHLIQYKIFCRLCNRNISGRKNIQLLRFHYLFPTFNIMKRIIVLMISMIGSWLGWWLGYHFNFTTAFFLSLIGTGAGIYAGQRLTTMFWFCGRQINKKILICPRFGGAPLGVRLQSSRAVVEIRQKRIKRPPIFLYVKTFRI